MDERDMIGIPGGRKERSVAGLALDWPGVTVQEQEQERFGGDRSPCLTRRECLIICSISEGKPEGLMS